jgi:uncharacterized membrane protein YgdD (TMEM256/DUF423 family)
MLIWAQLLVVLAGLSGAAGVAGAAAASHGATGPDLSIAAQFLMIHAGIIAAIALSPAEPRGAFLTAASVIFVGLALFAGDLTVRAYGGPRLFPMAAPAGGSLLILGWLTLAVAGAIALATRRS